MREMPAIIIGMAGAALLLGSLAPAAIEARNSDHAASVKGDRRAASRPADERVPVSLGGIVGPSRAAVVLEGRDGAVLFRSDPIEETTVIAKNVDLPIVSLKKESVRPAVEQPRQSRESNDPPPRDERKPKTVGCETALSVLVRHEASRVPRLCLAQAPAPVRS
jgi:hypothetical protein